MKLKTVKKLTFKFIKCNFNSHGDAGLLFLLCQIHPLFVDIIVQVKPGSAYEACRKQKKIYHTVMTHTHTHILMNKM